MKQHWIWTRLSPAPRRNLGDAAASLLEIGDLSQAVVTTTLGSDRTRVAMQEWSSLGRGQLDQSVALWAHGESTR